MILSECGEGLPNNLRVCEFVDSILTEEFLRKLIRESGYPVWEGEDNGEGLLLRTLNYQLKRVLCALDIKDGKILDLGCGASRKNVESMMFRKGSFGMYEPWLCRTLHKLGYNVLGIDIGEQKDEKFPHVRLNLLEDKLDFIETGSVDVANATMLFTSPELRRQITGEESAENAWLAHSEKLKAILLPQLERIVQPKGYFVYYR